MRETDAKCRKCRREGEKLFLKGEKCNGQNCAVVRRNTAPGQDSKSRRGKMSEFGKQLREKQKAKRIYGVNEKVFRNYYEKASKRKGVTGDNLLTLLELRLDNAIYRAGFADSRAQARQLASHRLFELDGRSVDIPSISLKPGNKLSLRAKSQNNPVVAQVTERKIKAPKWLKVDAQKKTIEIVRFPESDELESSVAMNLIVEFYSR
jgi:small subunit ribosomal protein S4